tara:strand:+ start:6883 stop:7059 length:177 start_codon:yes stop_codon:yes gene_type:complete
VTVTGVTPVLRNCRNTEGRAGAGGGAGSGAGGGDRLGWFTRESSVYVSMGGGDDFMEM